MSSSVAYTLPAKPGAIYLNISNSCLIDCLFCIKREGTLFYGSDLGLEKSPESAEIMEALRTNPVWPSVKEIIFCGFGESLLKYDCVLEVCRSIRAEKGSHTQIRIDTSGLFWAKTKRLDFLDWIDGLSVSLNAENAAKYDELCAPKIKGAYTVLMEFLRAMRALELERRAEGKPFPDIRLTVVDTSEEEYVPASGRKGYQPGSFPKPDIEKCREIASELGWPLAVRPMIRDSK